VGLALKGVQKTNDYRRGRGAQSSAFAVSAPRIFESRFWFVPVICGIISTVIDGSVLRKVVIVSNSDEQNAGVENPYSATYVPDSSTWDASNQQSRNDGYTQQIPVIGILMIVQGALESLYAMLNFGIGVFWSTMPMPPRGGMGEEPPRWVFSLVFFILGGIVLGVAVFRMVAGYFVFHTRSRVMALVANCIGLGTMVTCYCLPTSIALVIYSFIVLLQPSVIDAFARKELEMAN
jgi:hypothetical protein